MTVRAGGRLAKEPNIEDITLNEHVRQNKRSEPAAPEAKPDSEIADGIKNIKAWIVDIAGPKFKETDRRDKACRDGITRLNDRCTDNNSDTRKLWKEKDTEKQAKDQEIAELYRIIRQLKTDLAKKADKPKPAKA